MNYFTATARAAQRKGKAGKDKLSEHQGSAAQINKPSDRLNGMIMKCTFKNLYLACPTPVDSTDCKDLTAKMSQCPCEHEGRAGKKGEKKQKKEKKEKKGKQTEAPEPEM